MTITEILNYIPPRTNPIKTADPKLSTMLRVINDIQIEGDQRLFICTDINDTKSLRLIANQAHYHDFRMIALTKLALMIIDSVNWIRTKPRKIAKLTAEKLGIAQPIFSTWYREILLKALSDSQLEYLSRKAPENQRQDIDHERKTRGLLV